jgi:tetratricopeptide (TPR) repeat protein
LDKGGSRSPKKVDPPEADSSAKSGSAATAPPQNLQTAIAGVNVGGDFSATVNQTINYNQVLQDAKRIGIPLNLPQTNVTFFAGRDDDLQKVHELLQKNQKVAVSAFVKGMGGVGKSELALQYALRHLLTDYSGGICWLQGNEGTLPTQLQDFVQVQLRETMPDGLDSGEKLAGYCWRRLSERVEGQMLVVLDDVKDYGNVEPFLPTLDGKFRVLVTTRLGLGNAMQQYRLDVLVLAAAVDLLKSFLPEADPRRENEEAIKNLCTWLGRLPLAIELVGRYLARKPDLSIAKMQERLEAKKLQQEALTDTQKRALAEMTAKLNVAAAFDLSWLELSEGAQKLACVLSLFALAPIHWQWVIDAMGDVDEEDLETWRDDELLNLHLLERTQQGVYELHQLLREYFQFKLQQHPEWQVLRQQVAVSLLNISKGIKQTITLDFVKEVAPAIPHLEILGREMLDVIPNPEDDLVWAFLGIAFYYRSQGLYASAIPPLENCLKASESRLGADHPSVATSLNNLASLYESQGKYSEAEPLYLRSLSILERQLGADHPNVASSLNNLAALYRSQGKYSEAEPLYLRSLEIRERQLGADHPSVATSLNNLAELYRVQGKYSEAEPLYLRSLSIKEKQLGADHPSVATSLNNLALLYRSQGKYSEAEPLYLRSLEIYESQLGADHPSVATSLNNLAGLYDSQGKYSEAEPLYLRALVILEVSLGNDHPTTKTCRDNLQYLRELRKEQP